MNLEFELSSIAHLKRKIEELLSHEQIGKALDAIRDFVEAVIFDPRSVARVFSNEDVDLICRQIGKFVAGKAVRKYDQDRVSSGTVILATELVKAGGHVELIKDIIKHKLFDGPITVVLTDFFARCDRDLIVGFAEVLGVQVRVAQGQNSTDRFMCVHHWLCEKNPQTLVLVTHNQDSLGITLAHTGVAQHVVFIHHGDHHWSLGVTCEDFTHVDVTNLGYFHCKNELGLRNRYWPLTVNVSNIVPREAPFQAKGHLVTCSSGRPEKFDASNYLHDYTEYLPRILASTQGRHIHIGDLSAEVKARLMDGLSAASISPDSFVHIDWVPSLAMALLEHQVDLYISSFPLGGGKASIEAMAAGIPLLMHSNYRSRYHGGADLAYKGAMIWRSEAELMAIVGGITSDELAHHSALARRHYERYHADQALIEAADFSMPQSESDIPNILPYMEDSLQIFIDDTVHIQEMHSQSLEEAVQMKHALATARREIERVNSEWRTAVDEMQRIEREQKLTLGEVQRLELAEQVLRAELVATTVDRENLRLEKERLQSYLLRRLNSYRGLLGGIVVLTCRHLKNMTGRKK